MIDTLGMIPGYKTELTRREFEAALVASNFANTLATGHFAPDDGVLFRARQQLGAQALPGLVVASLLSKKVAAGITQVAFDVRVFRGGNFGETESEAAPLVNLLSKTARELGIEVHCVVSDGGNPAQPMIGRAEALRGLIAIIENESSSWLESHFMTCMDLARTVAGNAVREPVDRDALRRLFNSHLHAQGASGFQAAKEYLATISRQHYAAVIPSPARGYCRWQMAKLRAAILANQAVSPGAQPSGFSDGCGVELLTRPEEAVEIGTPVARVRGYDEVTLKSTKDRVARALTVAGTPRAYGKATG